MRSQKQIQNTYVLWVVGFAAIIGLCSIGLALSNNLLNTAIVLTIGIIGGAVVWDVSDKTIRDLKSEQA